MKITEEQINILNSFNCERLSSNSQNRELIKNFTNKRGDNLVEYLKQKGWEEDINGETAFYLIKNSEGIPCLFFSLKCGTLFEPLNEEELERNMQKIHEELKAYVSPDKKISSIADLGVKIAKLIKENDIAFSDIVFRYIDVKNMKIKTNSDKKKEGERPIVRVHKTMAGVELVHFCTNDSAKESWKKLKFIHTMGVVLFWFFIVPIIEQLQTLVGCQYVFLFAADTTIDGTLINYYKVLLNFNMAKNIGTSKPFYDFGCVFMSQEAKELREKRIHFFNNFNIDVENDDIV